MCLKKNGNRVQTLKALGEALPSFDELQKLREKHPELVDQMVDELAAEVRGRRFVGDGSGKTRKLAAKKAVKRFIAKAKEKAKIEKRYAGKRARGPRAKFRAMKALRHRQPAEAAQATVA